MGLLKGYWRHIARGRKGYTLLEVAAVVAITATLGAVVVPIAIDKVGEGKKSAARQDCQQIGGAISAFYKDVGLWPAMDDSGTFNNIDILTSGNDQGVALFSEDSHDPAQSDDINGDWGGDADLLDNHLVTDSPYGASSGYVSRGSVNWKGPYSESFKKRDPWGNNYLVYVRAMHTPTTGADKEYGWIISAGPNATLETGVLDFILKGDDIGFPLYSAETGH